MLHLLHTNLTALDVMWMYKSSSKLEELLVPFFQITFWSWKKNLYELNLKVALSQKILENSKSLSWAENLNKFFTFLGGKFKFSAQDSDLEYLSWEM